MVTKITNLSLYEMQSLNGGHTHTGNVSTCPTCSKKLPGTDNWNMGSAIKTYIIMFNHWLNS